MSLRITLPVAAVRWALTGPPGEVIDALAAGLIGAGMVVEPITPGTTYRIQGPTELLDVLAAELAAETEGFTLEHEMPPADIVRMSSTLAASHPFRRSVIAHGSRASTFVARAIDRRLSVTTEGAGRWAVTARTADLVAWLAAVYAKTEDDVLTLHGWTRESVAAEDSPTPVVDVVLPTLQVNVALPDRQKTSEITRDRDGEIVAMVSLETSIK